MCREPLETVDQLKKHLRGEHEVVKYRLDLVVALSTLSTPEEKRLGEEGKKRLAIMAESGFWHKEGDLFSGASQANPKIQLVKKETEDQGLAREIAEINKMLLDNNDGSREEEEDIDILEVIGNFTGQTIDTSTTKKIKEEPVFVTPPPSPVPDDETLLMEDIDDLDIQILEIIKKMPTKTGDGAFGKRIKLEPGVETPSPTSSTDPLQLLEKIIKVEAVDATKRQKETVIEDVSQTQMVEEKEFDSDDRDPVEETLPFCRLCYVTFSTHAEQMPHEEKVCTCSLM